MHIRILIGLGSLLALGCAESADAPERADAVVVHGSLPETVDLEEVFGGPLPETGFGLVVDDTTGEVAVIAGTGSRRSSDGTVSLSDHFVLDSTQPVSCIGCGDPCPQTQRIISLGLEHVVDDAHPFVAHTSDTESNFTLDVVADSTGVEGPYSVSMSGEVLSLSIVGDLGVCGTAWSHWFDLAMPDPAAPRLAADCTDADCTTIRLTLDPPSSVPPTWTIDSEGTVVGGQELDIATPPAGNEVLVEVEAGPHELAAILSSLEDDTGVGDTDVVILGHNGSCMTFSVRSVGGCIVDTSTLTFESRLNGIAGQVGDNVFDTDPDPALSGALGHGYYARWTPSALLPGQYAQYGPSPYPVMALSLNYGVEYYFALSKFQLTQIWAIHDSDPAKFAATAGCGNQGPFLAIPTH